MECSSWICRDMERDFCASMFIDLAKNKYLCFKNDQKIIPSMNLNLDKFDLPLNTK